MNAVPVGDEDRAAAACLRDGAAYIRKHGLRQDGNAGSRFLRQPCCAHGSMAGRLGEGFAVMSLSRFLFASRDFNLLYEWSDSVTDWREVPDTMDRVADELDGGAS